MAYLRKVKNRWRTEVEWVGVRRKSVLAEVVEGYRREITDRKTSCSVHADNLRFDAWLRDYPELANKVFHEITGG
ncbi:hypothetical protein D3C78_69610 [compost metagenome]|jgi:hypothetical protein